MRTRIHASVSGALCSMFVLMLMVPAPAAHASCSAVGVISLPGRTALGVDHNDGYLWVTSQPVGESDLCVISKINASTHQVESQSQEFICNGRGICFGGGLLWLTDALYDVIRVIDPLTFQQIRSFPTPGSEPCGITFDGGSLWLSDPNSRKIYNLNLDGIILGDFDISNDHTGLDWHDSLLYATSQLETIISFTANGQSDEEYVLECLPPGAHVWDFAIEPGGSNLVVSNLTDGKIYILSMNPVATDNMSWGGTKTLYR